jgi:hypothetical protein
MDIRELYKSLSPEDKIVYQQLRTCMRKLYLNAHNSIVGIDNWSLDDDALLDLFDIKIAVLFDRGGRIEGVKPIVEKNDTKTIENDIEKQGEKVTTRMQTEMSEASQKLKANGAAGW